MKKLYLTLCISTFILILLGAFVRTMGAGLACPDWPLCFGQFVPSYEFKVYVELSHRLLAGLVSILMVYCHIKLLRQDRVFRSRGMAFSSPLQSSTRFLLWGSFVLLAAQVVMGGLTVLLKLHTHVVATHLALGTAFLSCLCWIYWAAAAKGGHKLPHDKSNLLARALPLVLLLAVYGQIILGGMVAAGGAALVCTDFPLCQGSLIPTFKGVVGLQVMHRLGAYIVFILSVVFFVVARKNKKNFRWAHIIMALVVLQIGVGILNIKLFTPPVITILHLALATGILLCTLKVVHATNNN